METGVTLLADSNPLNLSLAEAQLSEAGCKVRIATSVDMVKSIINDHTPIVQIVFSLDCEDLDYKEIISMGRSLNVPLVGMTYHEDPESSEQWTKLSLAHILTVPLSPEQLKGTVITPVAGTQKPTLDYKMLQSIKDLGDDDPEFMNGLINLFFERSPTIIKSIEEAIDQTNHKSLEKHAHSLKGTCGNLGALAMMEVCETLEKKGREENMDDREALLTRLHDEFEKVSTILKEDWLIAS